MSSSSTHLPTLEGPGSVSGAPNLPDRFTDTFTSRYIDTGELRLHAVIGGEGPPLLLVHGWPENWYAWRLVIAEVPGPLGVNPSPPLFGLPEPINNKLWHLAFNRVNDEMTEQLVRGREEIFFGYEFAIQGGQKGLPDEVQRYYFDLYSDPDVPRGSFGL